MQNIPLFHSRRLGRARAVLLLATLAVAGCYSAPPSPFAEVGYGYQFDHVTHLRNADSIGVETPVEKQRRVGLGLLAGAAARSSMARNPNDGIVEAGIKQWNADYLINPRIRRDIDDALPDLHPALRQQLSTALGTVAGRGQITAKMQTRAGAVEWLKRNASEEVWQSARAVNFTWSFFQRIGVLSP